MDGDRRPSRRHGPSRYCSNCGIGLEPSMNYCPDCGVSTTEPTRSSTSGTATGPGYDRNRSSIGGGTDREVLEYRIARAARAGWKLERDFGDHAVMVRRTVGSVNEHLVVALLTVWFTMGIGNVCWGAYRYVSDAERIVLRAEPPVEDGSATATGAGAGEERSRSTFLGRATAVVCLAAAALVAAIGVRFGPTVFGYGFVALAAVFATLGVASLPSVRRRLERRRSIAANGRVRSVDERSVVAFDETCAACAATVGRGVERIYRAEYCVLGVPLTADEGRNYYCRRCADGNGPPTDAADIGAVSGRERSEATRPSADPDAKADSDAGLEDLEGGPERETEAEAEIDSDSESGRR